jgi:hypothetical protein
VLGFDSDFLAPDPSPGGATSSSISFTSSSVPSIPTYASSCDESQYSSACNCLGISASPTTTVYGVSGDTFKVPLDRD